TGQTYAINQAFLNAMGTACKRLMDMRKNEGRLLFRDLEGHLQHISQSLDTLEAHVPDMQSRYRRRLEEKMKAMTDTVDEERLLTEVAIFADKSDVSEELARLDAHSTQFKETL